MALIPLNQKFHTIENSVVTQERGSSLVNSQKEIFVTQDIIDTVNANLNNPSTYTMVGVFTNMFGGDPGGNNRDVLEWGGSSPAANHSSALPILQNCKITAAGFKWISSSTPTIGVGQSWTVNVYKLNNPLTDSTTADGNFTLVGALNITLTQADSGVTVGKFSSGLNLILNAGDIIRIAGDEIGSIGTTTDEGQLSVLFQKI